MLGIKGGAIGKKVLATKHKHMENKFKEIEALSLGSTNSLVLTFHGFSDQDEVKEYAEYVFSRIKMKYQSLEKPYSIQ